MTDKKKGGPIKKTKKKQISEELRRLFDTGEIMYLSERDLAVRLDVARETVRKYIEEIKRDVDPKDIKLVTVNLKQYLEDAIEDIRAMWLHSKAELDKEEMRKNIELMFKAVDKFTDFLERYFIKPKAMENINIQGELDITQKQVVINYNVPNGNISSDNT